MFTGTALPIIGLLVAVGAGVWAALLALAEEAAVGEALHTLGDAPPIAAERRVPLHRALHIARLALLILGAVATSNAVAWWNRSWVEALGILLIGTFLLFIVGDALPRSVARLAPELSESALPLARRTLAPFGPLFWLLGWADRGLHALIHTPRPLQPDLGVAQRDMLLGVFTLADTTVDEVMTPRLDMTSVDVSATTEEVLDTFKHSQHTRLPVLDGSADSLSGVLFGKDLVAIAMGLAEPGIRWQSLVRPAAFVPETKTLDNQLRDFQSTAAHIAIVVDEFGGTAGLITREDILEEIVGEIRDEHDAETVPAIRRDGNRVSVDGRVSLDELSAALGTTIAHEEVSTVGGLVYSILGRVPRPGDELSLDGYKVIVERVEQRRVTQVSFEKT
jgi:CBS domain containing-hemolysin-like protein